MGPGLRLRRGRRPQRDSSLKGNMERVEEGGVPQHTGRQMCWTDSFVKWEPDENQEANMGIFMLYTGICVCVCLTPACQCGGCAVSAL